MAVHITFLRPVAGASLFLCAALQSIAIGAEQAVGEPLRPVRTYDLRSSQDVFDVELTGTNPSRELELSLSPRVVDIVGHRYIRLPVSAKFAVNDHWDASVRIQPYVDSPIRGDSRTGVENVRFSTKYRLPIRPFGALDSAFGVRLSFPLEDEDEGITDGYRHFQPFAVISRTYDLENERQFQWFAGLALDFVGDAPSGSRKSDRRSELGLYSGILYSPPGHWRYAFYTEWNTTRIDGGTDDGFFLVPGLIYDPPSDRFPWLPGDWKFELAGKLGLDDADSDSTILLKLTIDFRAVASRAGYDLGL